METTLNPHIAAQVVRYVLTRARTLSGAKQSDAGRYVGTTMREFGKAAALLMDGKATSHPVLSRFPDWPAVLAFVEQGLADADTATLVNMVVAHGTKELIEAPGVAQPTMAGYESGRALPPRFHMKDLLDFYGRPNDYQKLVPLQAAAATDRPRGETVQVTGAVDGALRLGLDYFASEIDEYVPNLVVGMFQIEETARAVIDPFENLWPPVAPDVDQSLLRVERKEVLYRTDPPKVKAYVDELVLHKPLGGAEVQARQLDFLLEISEKCPHVSILVIPAKVVHHPANTSPLALLKFDDDADLAYSEDWRGSHYYNDSDSVGIAKRLLGHLGTVALERPESLALISDIRKEVRT